MEQTAFGAPSARKRKRSGRANRIRRPVFGKRNDSALQQTVKRYSTISLHRKIDFDRIDERDEPLEERLMHGVTVVRFKRRLTLEFHHAADHVALSARRNV